MEYASKFSGKNVLITGGLGFIGSNLAYKLLQLNPNRIVIVDNLMPIDPTDPETPEASGGNWFNINEIKDKIEVLNLDITKKQEMAGLIRGFKPDYIFSLAGLLSHVASLKNPRRDWEVNADSQHNILEPCVLNGNKVKIVYAGTRGQYGKVSSGKPINEESSILRPADPNGISKNAGEQICLYYGDHYENISATSLRMTNTYGPRHQMLTSQQGFASWFIRKAMDGEDITVFEPGIQKRDFNYVDDVVDALLRAMAFEETDGEVYNLGSCYLLDGDFKDLCGNIISVKDVAKNIVEISNTIAKSSGKFIMVPYPEERKTIEPGDIRMDFTKFRKATGWEPKTNLYDGLKNTIKFYLDNKETYW